MNSNIQSVCEIASIFSDIFHAQVGSDYYASKLNFEWAAKCKDPRSMLDAKLDETELGTEDLFPDKIVIASIEIISTRNVFLGTVFKCIRDSDGDKKTVRLFVPSENILKGASDYVVKLS